MQSLKKRQSDLSSSQTQIQWLESPGFSLPKFALKMKENALYPLKPQSLEIFQINMGKMCNQTCKHCHVDAGPDRKEIMTRETMERCLEVVREYKIKTVDLTGGAPEMNPDFRWFVEELAAAGAKVMVRCNLTIILANKKYHDLPHFFKKHAVEVVSSLPHYSKVRTDKQRGGGVFDKSIKALQLLNEVGYGKSDTDLVLNLVYNPVGSFLPGDQAALERDFKSKLKKDFDIDFNHLFCITNMPISRYLEYLIQSENYEDYMKSLVDAFNPSAAAGVMCRNTLSVGWDGQLYDCDFNQMLDLNVATETSRHINQFNMNQLEKRNIVIGQHCYGCTAGSGSSCGGTTA